jgi:type IV secretory pathway VirB10-like protein
MDKLFMNAVGKSSISAKTKTYDIDELTDYVINSGITLAKCKEITGKSFAKKAEFARYIAKKMLAAWNASSDDVVEVKKKPAKKAAPPPPSSDEDEEEEEEPVKKEVKKKKPAKKAAPPPPSSDEEEEEEEEPVKKEVKKKKPAKKAAPPPPSSDEEEEEEDEPVKKEVKKKKGSYETLLAKLKGVGKISDGTKAKDSDDLGKYVGTLSVDNLKKLTGNDTISDKSKLIKLAVSLLRKEWA